MRLQTDEQGHHAAQLVALRADVLRPCGCNAAILGTSTSSASCCDESHARGHAGSMLAQAVASCGMPCECWPLLGEFASRIRTAWIMYACRPSLDREMLAMR